MKYPLAVTKKLLEVFGEDIALGYDIACSFMKTVWKSALAELARRLRLTGITPSFHGHSHNRLCQVFWHPTYVEGIGKEDLEGCERLFSASNALASTTRLATPFHRMQDIEEHFLFWDEDKHVESGACRSWKLTNKPNASIGNFIYNNYRQALEIIGIGRANLAALEARLGTTAEDYKRFLNEERAYLSNLKKEPESTMQIVEYMEKLEKYWKAE